MSSSIPKKPLAPNSIRIQESPFALHSMKVRVPDILREVIQLNNYPEATNKKIQALITCIETNSVIDMIKTPAEDYIEWQNAYLAHDGDTWLDTEWFFAETFVYRHLIEIVGWFNEDTDPFAAKKRQEYKSAALWQALDQALDVLDNNDDQRGKLSALLHADLWGNSIDLSYALAASHGNQRDKENLLIDDAGKVADYLLSEDRHMRVDFVLDNTGTELAMDLVLAAALLDGVAESVFFHVKWHPTYVSDATATDIHELLSLFGERSHDSRESLMAHRLEAALIEGRFQLVTDRFWNSSRYVWEKPNLADTFKTSSLVIFKGDMNYRRLLGDTAWDERKTFEQVVGYMPVPTLALRTMKSPALVGLSQETTAQLDEIDGDSVTGWRLNGKRGVVQFKR